MGLTLFDKIWEQHLVTEETSQTPAVLYVDLHLLHEVTSPQAFSELEQKGISVRRPELCLATIDHAVPTLPPDKSGKHVFVSKEAQQQVEELRKNCATHAIKLHDWDSAERGIVHIIGPELGATQPGMKIVCGDSHTSTHGAFGALAIAIGTTEVGHVLASQCLLQRKPGSMEIVVDGQLVNGVSAKDVILHIIGKIGVDGATGMVIEYRGSTISAMDMEERMTLCNMSIECGAKAGMVAPDEKTINYIKGRKLAPRDEAWDDAVTHWLQLKSDPDSGFDRSVKIDAREIRPTISYGTNPSMVIPVSGAIPSVQGRQEQREAIRYMGFAEGETLLGKPVDIVFIGSCTNARLTDLQVVADVLKDASVAENTLVIIVPGSVSVKHQAEALGLDKIFIAAGAQWRNPGCSMCIAMNGDFAGPGEYVVSTSNRNFVGRQGAGARTLLASPLTAAVCALSGTVTDPLEYLENRRA